MTDMQCLNLLAPIAMEERTVSALVSSGVCRTYLCSPVYAHGFEHFDLDPEGHPKLLHFWPVKLLQAGQGDYAGSGVMASRAAASLSR